MNSQRRKIDKIYGQIDKLSKKGKDQVYEYYKLIDDLVSKGEYSLFQECLDLYYKISITKYSTVSDTKIKTWPLVRFLTNSSFLTLIKKLYDKRGVYEIGLNVYTTSTISNSILLGQIREYDIYTQSSNILVQDENLVKILGMKKTFLGVTKEGDTHGFYKVETNDMNLSEDQNLLNRYNISIDILLGGNIDDYVDVEYVEIDYI